MALAAEHATHEITAVRRADGESRTLAASLPRLVLEARRIAANVDPRPARTAARRIGRKFLAVPPLRVGRAVAERRLAALRPRRSSLCPRAGMGGRVPELSNTGTC